MDIFPCHWNGTSQSPKAGGWWNSPGTARFTKPPDCTKLVSKEHSCRQLHSQPMDIFPFLRNCASQSHGTAGNRKAGGFVNCTVSFAKGHHGSTCLQWLMHIRSMKIVWNQKVLLLQIFPMFSEEMDV